MVSPDKYVEPEIGEAIWDMNDTPHRYYFRDRKGREWKISPESWQSLPIAGGTKLIEKMVMDELADGEPYSYLNKMLVVLEFDTDDGSAKAVYSYDDNRIGVMSLEHYME